MEHENTVSLPISAKYTYINNELVETTTEHGDVPVQVIMALYKRVSYKKTKENSQ